MRRADGRGAEQHDELADTSRRADYASHLTITAATKTIIAALRM
jgi:hypothetical protein